MAGRRHPVGRQRGVRRYPEPVKTWLSEGDWAWLSGEMARLGVSEAEVMRRLVGAARGMSEARVAVLGEGVE